MVYSLITIVAFQEWLALLIAAQDRTHTARRAEPGTRGVRRTSGYLLGARVLVGGSAEGEHGRLAIHLQQLSFKISADLVADGFEPLRASASNILVNLGSILGRQSGSIWTSSLSKSTQTFENSNRSRLIASPSNTRYLYFVTMTK